MANSPSSIFGQWPRPPWCRTSARARPIVAGREVIVAVRAGGAPTSPGASSGHGCRKRLGQQFVIEMPGPVAISAPRRSCARPRGRYTLALIGARSAINAHALSESSFKFRPRHRRSRYRQIYDVMVGTPTVRQERRGSSPMPGQPGKSSKYRRGRGSTPPLRGRAVHDDGAGTTSLHVAVVYSSVAAAMTDLLSGRARLLGTTASGRSNSQGGHAARNGG